MVQPENAKLLVNVIFSCFAQVNIRLGVSSLTDNLLLIATQFDIVASICATAPSDALTVPIMPPVEPPPSTVILFNA